METVCPQCGGALAPGSLVCSFCGTRIEPPPPTTAPVAFPQQPGTNGLAIASLVLSLLWLVGVASLAAVITGYYARKQIKQTGERGSGLATAGLAIGTFGLITGILIVSLGTIFGGKQTAHDSARARSDILSVAAAETNFFNTHHRYPVSTAELGIGVGVISFNEAINAATGPTDFCVVGTYGVDEPWFLYDSSNGGATLTTESYDTEVAAENACLASKIGSFTPFGTS